MRGGDGKWTDRVVGCIGAQRTNRPGEGDDPWAGRRKAAKRPNHDHPVSTTRASPPTEHQIRYLQTSCEGQIQNSLEPFGYYQAQVEAELTPPADPQKEAWQAVYKIERRPGAPEKMSTSG